MILTFHIGEQLAEAQGARVELTLDVRDEEVDGEVVAGPRDDLGISSYPPVRQSCLPRRFVRSVKRGWPIAQPFSERVLGDDGVE